MPEGGAAGYSRVGVTDAAAEMLRHLAATHGQLMFHQSGGCCDGSSPMCYPVGMFRVGAADVLLGTLHVEGIHPVEVYMSRSQFEYWKYTHLTIDLVDGRGSGFSIEAPEGKRFLIRSRMLDDAELAAFGLAQAPACGHPSEPAGPDSADSQGRASRLTADARGRRASAGYPVAMSTIRHPVGPQPKRVYWRRRLVVLFVLVAIVAIVVLIVVRPGPGAGAEGGTPAGAGATPGPSVSSEAPDADSTPAAGSLEGADAAAAGSGAVAGDPCLPENISVVPVTDATNYAAGANPQISFTITNTGPVSCTVNAGTTQQVYTITSGTETYWTSTDCQTDPVDAEALLDPGVAVSSTPFTWDRTRSAPDTCGSADRPAVPAGGASYHLTVSVAGIPSATTQQFLLN